MWLAYACGSAFFAGITAILAKVGIKKIDSNLATAIRTVVVLIFAWIMVRLTGSYTPIGSIGTRTLIYLTLSGIATGASWLCYFRALQLGDVNKVTPIDKSSTILTMILAVIFLNEGLNEKKQIVIPRKLCLEAVLSRFADKILKTFIHHQKDSHFPADTEQSALAQGVP